MRLRCSALPLVSACAASALPGPRWDIGDRDIPALGRAVHHCLKCRRTRQPFETADVARLFGVEPAALGKSFGRAWNAWRRVEQYFPRPECEVSMAAEIDGITLTGTADVLDPSFLPRLHLADDKTGWGEAHAEAQLRGYAILALGDYPEAKDVYAMQVQGSFEVRWHWTREELTAWWADFRQRLAVGAYTPGTHCSFCARGPGCDGRTLMVRQACEALVGASFEPDELSGLAECPEQLVDLHERAKLVEKMAGDIQSVIKGVVAEAGGSLRCSDGRELYLADEQRRTIHYAEALETLRAVGIEQARLEACAGITKGDVEELLGEVAPYRRKGQLIKATMEQLEKIGAVEVKTIQKLKMRRHPAPALTESEAGQ